MNRVNYGELWKVLKDLDVRYKVKDKGFHYVFEELDLEYWPQSEKARAGDYVLEELSLKGFYEILEQQLNDPDASKNGGKRVYLNYRTGKHHYCSKHKRTGISSKGRIGTILKKYDITYFKDNSDKTVIWKMNVGRYYFAIWPTTGTVIARRYGVVAKAQKWIKAESYLTKILDAALDDTLRFSEKLPKAAKSDMRFDYKLTRLYDNQIVEEILPNLKHHEPGTIQTCRCCGAEFLVVDFMIARLEGFCDNICKHNFSVNL